MPNIPIRWKPTGNDDLAVTSPPACREIEWQERLDDDAVSEPWRGLVGCWEQLNDNLWFVAVYRAGGGDAVFHSNTHDIHPLSVEAAKMLCEMAMKALAFEEFERLSSSV